MNLPKAIPSLFFTPFFPLLLCAVTLICYKVYYLEMVAQAAFGCQWCVISDEFLHEGQFLLLIIALHLSSLSAHSVIRISFRVLLVVALLIAAIDIIVIKQFLVRFTLHEFLKFVTEYHAAYSFVKQLIKDWFHGAILISSGVLLFIIIRYFNCVRGIKNKNLSIVASLYIAIIAIHQLKPLNYHTPYLQNAIEAFVTPQGRHTPYSAEFTKATLESKSENNRQCYAPVGARPDIILVIVESLSMYHSKSFSGYYDWTPQLDHWIEKYGIKFTNFYANGFTTEDGLISLLTGTPPIPKGIEGAKTIFDQFKNIDLSLAVMFNDLGYQTLFLTTGNLGFLNKESWLNNIGFQYTEGHNAPFYSGMKRFHFDAASDEALYARAIQKIQEQKKNKQSPFFLTLENVSTHHPYVDPISGENSEEKVFRYADAQLGKFIQELKNADFFQNGYVIVVSDHRAMLPMKSFELDLYGEQAYNRIPLAIIGEGMQGTEVNPFSQTDLLPSLQYWLSNKKVCVDENQGIFAPTVIQKPKCSYLRRSYNLNRVYIQCDNIKYSLELDADQTRFINIPKGSKSLLNQLNRLRLSKNFN